MSKRRDDEIVRAVLSGERDAFDELMLRYQKRIFNLAYKVTGSVDDAMDATQNTFLKAYDHLDRFDTDRPFFSWIYRIGLNESLDLIRARDRYLEGEPEVEARRPSPEETCRGHETGDRIQEALLELKPDHRTVIVLRHFYELSYAEMSDVIGVPARTVKSRLFTARRDLRRRLTEEGLL